MDQTSIPLQNIAVYLCFGELKFLRNLEIQISKSLHFQLSAFRHKVTLNPFKI